MSITTVTSTPAMSAAVNAAAMAKPTAKHVTPTDALAKNMASQAFKEDKQGKALVGTAEQRMAYAVRVHMAQQHAAKSNLPDLLCTSDDDKKALRKHLPFYFIGEEAPKKKLLAAKHGAAIASDMIRTYTAMAALVSRGVRLATLCTKHGVPWHSFNAETNSLLVKAEMLLPEDCTPLGRLATEKYIALDGRNVSFMRKAENGSDFPDNAAATVTHMYACIDPKKRSPQTPDEKLEEEVKKVATAENLIKYIETVPLIMALYTKLVKEWSGDPIIAVNMPSEAWNAWNTLVMTMDHAAEQPGFLKSVDSKDASKEAVAFAKRNAA